MRNPIPSASTSKTTPCCSKVGIKRGPWTPEEDELLANYIKREGEGRWRTMPKGAGLVRCGKSCRLRWMNYLRPSVKRGQITPDEEDLILRLHRLLGNRWSLIAGRIPGRTDNEIKNYWNTHLSKKLISQGMDPRTHKPLNPTPNSSEIAHDRASTSDPNPNPNFSGLEMGIKSSENIPVVDYDNNETRRNSDGLMMGHGNNNKEDDVGYCNEDVFSSFLNSLINEDVFVNQQTQTQMPNLIAPSSYAVVSSVQTFNNGRTAWEDAVLTSTMADLGDDDEQNGLNQQTT